MDQQTAPLLEIAQRYLDIDDAPFYMPGHKRGQGIDRDFADLLGKKIFRLDLPELPDLEEPIAQAQALAAHAYGSDRTWFLTNGSKCFVLCEVSTAKLDGDSAVLRANRASGRQPIVSAVSVPSIVTNAIVVIAHSGWKHAHGRNGHSGLWRAVVVHSR